MQFNEYQIEADKTAIYPGKGNIGGLVYTALGLSEAGEVQGKVKKILRDKGGFLTPEDCIEIGKELGDTLWYIAQTATELNLSLDDIAKSNILKLQSRKERGVLQGNGDNR